MSALIVHDADVDRGRRTVLRGAKLRLDPGVLGGLIGPNGAGKSTLLRAMVGLSPPSRGTVRIDERDVYAMSSVERARSIAFLPQSNPARYAFSVRDIVALGQHARRAITSATERARDLDEALAWAELEPLADRSVLELSGGEYSRVLLARAYVTQARWLILDEPAAHLDVEHQLQFFAKLEGLVEQGRGVLIAMHDLPLAARRCHALTLLHRGEIVASGTPASVLTSARLAEVFGVRATLREDGERLQLTVEGLAEC